jgi:hypothetical protein
VIIVCSCIFFSRRLQLSNSNIICVLFLHVAANVLRILGAAGGGACLVYMAVHYIKTDANVMATMLFHETS